VIGVDLGSGESWERRLLAVVTRYLGYRCIYAWLSGWGLHSAVQWVRLEPVTSRSRIWRSAARLPTTTKCVTEGDDYVTMSFTKYAQKIKETIISLKTFLFIRPTVGFVAVEGDVWWYYSPGIRRFKFGSFVWILVCISLQKSWDIALGPLKQLPMNLFIMWMAGNSISIFPIMMVGMMFIRPIQAFLSIQHSELASFAVCRMLLKTGILTASRHNYCPRNNVNVGA